MIEDKESLHNNNPMQYLVERFEQMLQQNEQYYFDVEEFEEIIDYYFIKNNLAKVRKVIQYALSQHPYSADLTLRKAEWLAAINQHQKALVLLKKLALVEPCNPEIFFAEADIHSQRGYYEKAIQCLDNALQYSTDDIDDIHLTIAFEYENLNNYIKAIYHLKKALKINPENIGAMYELGFCYEMTERYAESIEYYNRFLDEHPYSSVAWYNLGTAYSQLDEYEKAIQAYDFSIAIQDDFTAPYFNKAHSYVQLKNYDKAILVYKEILKYEEPSAYLYHLIGECYEKKENYEMAFNNFDRALQLEPDFADAWIGKSVCLFYQQRLDDALHYIKEAIKLDDTNAEYWYIIGEIYDKMECFEDANKSYRKVIELDAKNTDIWLDYSHLCRTHVNVKEAITIISEGIKIHPQCADLYYRISAYWILAEDMVKAINSLQTALSLELGKNHQLEEYLPEAFHIEQIMSIIEAFKRNSLQ